MLPRQTRQETMPYQYKRKTEKKGLKHSETSCRSVMEQPAACGPQVTRRVIYAARETFRNLFNLPPASPPPLPKQNEGQLF